MDKETTVFIKVCDTCEDVIKENSPFFRITPTSFTTINIEHINGDNGDHTTIYEPLDFCSETCMKNYFSEIAKELSKNKD